MTSYRKNAILEIVSVYGDKEIRHRMWGVFRRGTYTGSGILIDQGGSNNGRKVNKKAEKQQGKKEKDTGIFRIAWGDHHTLCAGSLYLSYDQLFWSGRDCR